MKNSKWKMADGKGWFGLLMVVGLVAAIWLPPPVLGQVTPTTWSAFTGVPAYVEGGAQSNLTSTAISVRKDRGLSIIPIFAGTNSGTANLIFTGKVSPDKTNWCTVTPFTYTVAMNGTTGVVGYTNWPPTLLNNVAWFQLTSISNGHTASVYITNVLWSVSAP